MISLLQRPPARGRINPATLRRRATRLLAAIDRADAELCVVLTDDEEITALNRDYRGKDQPTDVLSFAQEEGEAMPLPPGETAPLGDVIISLDTAERQLADGCLPRLWPVLGSEGPPVWTLLDEVTFLLLHGVLHLIGHDHIDADDAAVMEALEAKLLPSLLNRRP